MAEQASVGWPVWIGVVVEDLREQNRFWSGLLGRPETTAGSDYVQFDMGAGRIFELLQRTDDVPQYDRIRFQVGFAVADVQRARDKLLKLGAEPITGIMVGHQSPWMSLRDREGNVFEITERATELEGRQFEC